jgi:hypothetical protein
MSDREQALEQGKEVARAVKRFFDPNADAVNKIQDALLFHAPIKAAILFAVVNLAYIAFTYFLHPSIYSVLFLAYAIYQLSPYWLTAVRPVFKLVFLGGQPANIPSDSKCQRYHVNEISAFVGTVYFALLSYWGKSQEAVTNKSITLMSVAVFFFLLFFYFFISFKDRYVVGFLLNAIFLLPFLLRRRVTEYVENLDRNWTTRLERPFTGSESKLSKP